MSDKLCLLLEKYGKEIKSLEIQLNTKKSDLETVREAIKLLAKDMIEPLVTLTNHYKYSRIKDAILNIVNSSSTIINCHDIRKILIIGGFKSNSKDLKRDVHTILSRLGGSGRIKSVKVNGLSMFQSIKGVVE